VVGIRYDTVYWVARTVFYPHMLIGKVWIYRLLFVFVCVILYGYGFLRRVTNANGSRGVGFSARYLKTNKARITRSDICSTMSPGVKRSKSRVTAWVFTLLWVLASSIYQLRHFLVRQLICRLSATCKYAILQYIAAIKPAWWYTLRLETEKQFKIHRAT